MTEKFRPYVAGITGGIASGKTAAGDIIKRLGGVTIDADEVSRAVLAREETTRELAAAFPEAFSGGTLDRKRLRDMVFFDERRLKTLNDITHPAIIAELERQIEECGAAGTKIAFLIVPLMFETGCDRLCDTVVAVSAPEELRIERLMKRNNIPRETALAMISAQMPEPERVARADLVIVNDGDLAALEEKVTRFYRETTQKSI